MKFNFFFLLAFLPLVACTQHAADSAKVETEDTTFSSWTTLAKGVEYIETLAPQKSIIGDSKLSILRIDPEFLDFVMLNATQFDNKRLTAPQWADSFDLQIVMNAGMYDMANGFIHRGYSKNKDHYNNDDFNPDYNSMIAFNPIDSLNENFDILDLQCQPWQSVCTQYQCFAQGMRMIDCNGEAMGWNKKKQTCSMLVAAKDQQGRIWFIFSRSPYSHNQMISFLGSFPEGLHSAIYLEGGPETSLFIQIGDVKIEKIGSYVSGTYPKDNNWEFWELPNVIGIRTEK